MSVNQESVHTNYLDAAANVRDEHFLMRRFSKLGIAAILSCSLVQPQAYDFLSGTVRCPEVSQEFVKDTEAWLAEPLHNDIERLMAEEAVVRGTPLATYNFEMTFSDSNTWHTVRKASIRKYKQALAAANNLTVFHPEDTYARLFPEGIRKLTEQEELIFTREFIGQYGVVFDPGDADLTTTHAISLMSRIREAFAQVPRQFIEATKVNKITLTEGGDFGVANLLTGSISFNVTSEQYQSTGTVMHELFHHWDAQHCGTSIAAQNDPGFAAANQGHDRKQGLSEDLYKNEMEALELKHARAVRYNDFKNACGIQQELTELGGKIYTPTAYSKKSSDREEKAELAQAFTDSELHSRYLSPYVPVLKSEYTYLYASLREGSPSVANYLRGMTAPVYTRAPLLIC